MHREQLPAVGLDEIGFRFQVPVAPDGEVALAVAPQNHVASRRDGHHGVSRNAVDPQRCRSPGGFDDGGTGTGILLQPVGGDGELRGLVRIGVADLVRDQGQLLGPGGAGCGVGLLGQARRVYAQEGRHDRQHDGDRRDPQRRTPLPACVFQTGFLFLLTGATQGQ